MSKTVIHVFGSSGAGTSTLGRYICEKTGFFFMDTDDYFWEATDPPFSLKREPSERLRLMRAAIDGHDAVVLSGSFTGWGDPLIPLFTLAVRVETLSPLRLERLRRRERELFGSRIDPGGDMYEKHRAFIEWAAAYDRAGPEQRSAALHDLWQRKLRCPLVTVDGSRSPEENFGIIREYLRAAENH